MTSDRKKKLATNNVKTNKNNRWNGRWEKNVYMPEREDKKANAKQIAWCACICYLLNPDHVLWIRAQDHYDAHAIWRPTLESLNFRPVPPFGEMLIFASSTRPPCTARNACQVVDSILGMHPYSIQSHNNLMPKKWLSPGMSVENVFRCVRWKRRRETESEWEAICVSNWETKLD